MHSGISGLVEGMVVDLNSRSILDKNEEVFFNTWDEIAQGRVRPH